MRCDAPALAQLFNFDRAIFRVDRRVFCLLASVHSKSFHRPIKHVLFSFWFPSTVLIIRFHLCSWNFCVFINTSVKLNVVAFFSEDFNFDWLFVKMQCCSYLIVLIQNNVWYFVHLSRFFFLHQHIKCYFPGTTNFLGKKMSQIKLTILFHRKNAANNDCLDKLSRNCFFYSICLCGLVWIQQILWWVTIYFAGGKKMEYFFFFSLGFILSLVDRVRHWLTLYRSKDEI